MPANRLVNGLRAGLLCVTTLVVPAVASTAEAPPMPPLVTPASDVRHPGKFIWADLFTSDLDGQRAFYGTLFGWEWRWVSDDGQRYGVFHNGTEPVAGIAQYRPADAPDDYARWAHYISVTDVDAAVAATRARGGRVLLERRDIPDRGAFAILADAEEAPFAVLDSASGDPEDYQVDVGSWLWVQLFSRDARAATEFYREIFGYAVHESEEHTEVLDFVLATEEFSRAAVAQLADTAETAPLWLGFVRVADLDATLARAPQLGGKVILAPSPQIAGGDLAVIADPVGAPVGLMRWSYPDDSVFEEKAK